MRDRAEAPPSIAVRAVELEGRAMRDRAEAVAACVVALGLERRR